jgi:beta-ketodecanoyl-[acyl-carrier-protein] synthase
MMTEVFITASGIAVPEYAISNDELVAAFNLYVQQFNQQFQSAITAGDCEALQPSSSEFIEKASGIKNRFVIEKNGILNPDVMHPLFAERPDDALSLQAEFAVKAARQALVNADLSADKIDGVIVACSNLQRAYPAIAIEVQAALGCGGFAYDMNVACSSGTFGLHNAYASIAAGSARNVLVISPEITSGHQEWRDRDCHFIFGDVAAAMVVQHRDEIRQSRAFKIHSQQLWTQFSSNIRNNFGFLNRCTPEARQARDKTFYQNGRKAFKDVVAWVSELLAAHLAQQQLSPSQIKRFWLHQANLNMNLLIMKKILGHDPEALRAPIILDRFANTSSAGSLVAFHEYQQDLQAGDLGVLSSFGAGYSAGCLVLECTVF